MKDLAQADSYVPHVSEQEHRATYCVWELGIVWHERGAWMRYLLSERNVDAKLSYINDRFSGHV